MNNLTENIACGLIYNPAKNQFPQKTSSKRSTNQKRTRYVGLSGGKSLEDLE